MAAIVANCAISLNCELTQPVKVQYIDGNMFSMDNAGNTAHVYVFYNGEPQEIVGSVSADVIRSDGTTVAITGAMSGNRAYVIFPQSCYAVPGVVSVVIKVTEGTTVTTIAAFVANVYRSSTDAIVDPGTIIPSVQNLISAIETAVASIPADYSSLWESLAPDYANITFPVTAGKYCTYNGTLYIAKVDIATTESFTAAHWQSTNIGDNLSALKSAIDVVSDENNISVSGPINARISSGAISSASYARLAYANIENQKRVTVSKDAGKKLTIGFTEQTPANGVSVTGSFAAGTATEVSADVPTGAKYVAIYYYNNNDGETESAADMLASIKVVGITGALDEVARKKIDQAENYDIPSLESFRDDTAVKRASYNLFNGNLTKGYISKNGTVDGSTSYRYTDKIDVHDLIGETVSVYNDGSQSYIRFVCIYGADNTVKSSLGTDTNALTFTIPSGAYYAVFSFANSSVNTPYVLITAAEDKTVYIPHEIKWGINNYPAVDAFVNIAEPLVLSAASLADDGELKAKTGNGVKTYGTYSMFCRPGTMTADEYIIFGKDSSNGYAVGISKTKWAWFVNGSNQGSGTHGLTIKDYLFVTVNKVPGTGAVLTIYTNGGTYARTNTSWQDYHGLQYIKNESGDTITDVKMTWGSSAFRHGIWFFGDSYVSGSDARWPYYINQLGFNGNILINGFPGEETKPGYKDFIDCLNYGKPTIAVWCLGMNNADSDAINSTWKKYTEAFLDVCELFDITPVLATIPCCPLTDHSYKNAWVRASGKRYIEFANAVNVTEDSTTWYDDMLANDNIHPTAQGAKTLASQIIVSVPEIIEP